MIIIIIIFVPFLVYYLLLHFKTSCKEVVAHKIQLQTSENFGKLKKFCIEAYRVKCHSLTKMAVNRGFFERETKMILVADSLFRKLKEL